MAQNFMYKRVNIFLLILMCLIVVGLAASAIYFQESFKNLNTNYQSVLSNFTTCSDILSTKETKLNICIDNLNSTAIDIGKYDSLYEKKEGELETTQEELKLTDLELKKTKLEVQKAQNLYQEEFKRAEDLERQISFLNQQIIQLQGTIKDLNNRLDVC